VTVEIDSTGAVVVKTTGFVGASCQDATRALEKALGQVTTDTKTPEFLQHAGQTGSQHSTQRKAPQ
jgi:hypothetical protein